LMILPRMKSWGRQLLPFNHCCGSEIIFFGFGSTHFFRIRIFILIFWPEIFSNGASHSFYMCFGICTTEKKVLQRKPLRFFLFQVFDLRFFTLIFILQQCLDPNPNPNFFSDSDPAKIFGLFRIRIHNTALNMYQYRKFAMNFAFLFSLVERWIKK
jgi:hypothetical protein